MVWVPPECSCRGHRATTNTIVQWPWGDTHAPITCALFADVINRVEDHVRRGGGRVIERREMETAK